MKRRDFIKSAGLGVAGAAVAAPAIAQSMPELKWRMTSSFPKSLDTIYGAGEVFAKAVAEATDNKFQIQLFAAGEIVPALAGRGRSQQRHRRDVPYGFLLLHRQGSDVRLRHRSAVRPEQPHADCMVAERRRRRADERVLQEVQHHRVPCRQHRLLRWAAGFARKSRSRGDLNGLKMRIGGFAGQVLTKLGLVPQQIAGGDIYPCAGEGHDRCSRVGWSVRRREARLQQGREVLLLSRLVGRRSGPAQLRQHRQVERAAASLQVDHQDRIVAGQRDHAGPLRCAQSWRR